MGWIDLGNAEAIVGIITRQILEERSRGQGQQGLEVCRISLSSKRGLSFASGLGFPSNIEAVAPKAGIVAEQRLLAVYPTPQLGVRQVFDAYFDQPAETYACNNRLGLVAIYSIHLGYCEAELERRKCI
jgi:hypothetical protein